MSAPLTQDTTVIGGGAVHLWIKASTPNVDLQATVSEVDPDGDETFVQNGWLRADERKLAPGSTLLEPMPDLRKSAVEPLPSGQFVEVTIPLYYEGHVYRAGSRIRVTISAPGGAEPLWAFAQTNPAGTANVSVRALAVDAVEHRAACGSGGQRACRRRRGAAMPEPAQRALPDLRALWQPGCRQLNPASR